MDPRVDERAEIEEAVGRALSALGLSGTIAIEGNTIELSSDGRSPVAIDVELVIRQWPLLPPDMRRRKADEVALRLSDGLRAASASGRVRPAAAAGGITLPARFWAAVAAGIGVLLLIGIVKMILPRLGGEKVEAKTPSEDDVARRDRLARACVAMRDRLYQGASFGPFATEGWAVELWLASRKGGTLKDHPALTGVIANGKLTAAGDDEIAHVTDGTVEIADGFSEDMGHRSPAWGGAILVFREGYARAFLEPETRERFIILADRLAEAAGADAGALYARCAHLATHDIGAWYHGADTTGAIASMVYQVGFFAEGKLLDSGSIAALRAPGGDLDALKKAAGDVAGDTLTKMITAQGGSVNTAHGVSLVFPLAGPTRPIAATRAVARKMGVGVGTD